MVDLQRMTGFIFKKTNPVKADNASLQVFGSKKDAENAFQAKSRDGKDDLLIKDGSSKNYFLMSADRIDFTTVGQDNKVKLGRSEGKVVKVNDEGREAARLSREEGGFFSKKDVPVRLVAGELVAITEKEDKKHLLDRMARDGQDNLILEDEKSDNTFLVSADSIDFTTVGVGNTIKVGDTEGKVTHLDDER